MWSVIEFLSARFGLDPTRGGLLGTLENHVAARLAQLGIDERAYIARVRGDLDEQQRLVHAITVRHSWFYRDPGQLQAVATSLRSRSDRGSTQPVDVWVAGCACGEEAWTIAMIATDLGVPIRLRATDLDIHALDEAREGQYSAWSLRELPEPLHRFLEPSGDGRWKIGPQLRSIDIEFAVHNLCDPAPAGSFDLISCRNVLIYFDPVRAQAVAEQLRTSLRPGGELVLGAGDLLFRPDDKTPSRQRLALEQPSTTWPRPQPAKPGRSLGTPSPKPRAPEPAPTPVVSVRSSPRAEVVPTSASAAPTTASAAPTTASVGATARPAPGAGALQLAAQAVESGDYGGALAHLTDLVAADPLDFEAHLWAGIAHYGLGQEQDAAEALRRARCLAPQLWPATLFAALTNERRGMWGAAARCWIELARTMSSADAPAIQGTVALLDALPRWRVEALALARQRNSKHPAQGSND